MMRLTRAQGTLLVLNAMLVTAAVCAAVVVPRLVTSAADAELEQALTEAGTRADVVLSLPFPGDDGRARELAPDTAGATADLRERLSEDVPAELREVLGKPTTVATSLLMKAGSAGDRPLRLRFAYVADESTPSVTWIAGSAPAETATAAQIAGGEPVVVEVAVSEAVASAWDVTPGDERTLATSQGEPVMVSVSGVFAPANPADPAWSRVPELLTVHMVGGAEARAEAAVLLSDASLPYAVLALAPSGMARTFVMSPRADAVPMEEAPEVAELVRGLSSGKQVFSVYGQAPRVTTSFDRVIDAAVERARAAHAQATVMMAGLLATAVLTLALSSGALARRRSRVIDLATRRGASRSRVVLAVSVEAVLVTSVGAGVGLAAASLVPGAVEWWWVAVPVVAGVALPPAAIWSHAGGTVASREAIASARRRRVVAMGVLVTVTVLAWVALVRREPGGADAAVALAPVALASVAAMVTARALPGVWRMWRRIAARRRRAPGLVAASLTTAPAAALAATIVGVALMTAVSVAQASARQGGEHASWDVVGADAVVSGTLGSDLPEGSEELADAAQVSAAGAVREGVQVVAQGVDETVTVLAVDPVQFAAALDYASLNVADMGALSADAPTEAAVPVVVRGLGFEGPVTMRWDGRQVPIEAVGRAPALPGRWGDQRAVIVIPRNELAEAIGDSVEPTIMWLDGAGAEQAARAIENSSVDVVIRTEWVEALTASPVAQRGAHLTSWSVLALAAVTLVAAVMWSLADAASRSRALARLAVLGFAARDRRRIALWGTAWPVVVACIVGTACGIGMAAALLRPLGLEVLAGGSEVIATVVPWWIAVAPLAVVGVAVAIGMRASRVPPARLGGVLREG